MANPETYLKPLIDICDRISSGPDDCKSEIAELRNYAAKGAFYECHSFTRALELLTDNPKLKTAKKAGLLEVLKTLVQEGTSNKDYIISKLQAFIGTLKASASSLLAEMFLNKFIFRITLISPMAPFKSANSKASCPTRATTHSSESMRLFCTTPALTTSSTSCGRTTAKS